MVCGFGACYVCMRTFEVDGKRVLRARLPGRPGVQHAGGRGMVDLSVKIGDITLQNPVKPASGAFSWEYNDVIDLNRLGGLVAKTICREPRLGNPTPRMAETEGGIIQSIGLPGKGIDYFIEHIVPGIREVQAAADRQRVLGKHRGFRRACRRAERAGRRRDRSQYLLPDPQCERRQFRHARGPTRATASRRSGPRPTSRCG